MSDVGSRRALVVGLGVTGEAVAEALARRGAAVRIADRAETPTVHARADRLAGLGVDCRIGRVEPADLDDVDLVVPSPGVPESSPVLAEALRRGLDVWSEPELAWQLNAGRTRLVAVTGTNGKTTVTELLGACLDAPTGGNIGRPLVGLLADDPPPLVVAELSSFQLRFVRTLAPEVAVLLNLAPDHLDWHGSLGAYEAAKAQVWAHQTPESWTVVNADDEGACTVAARRPPPGRVLRFTTSAPGPGEVGVEGGAVVARHLRPARPIIDVDDIALPGRIGRSNAVAAAAAALCAGAPPPAIAAALRTFEAGPHRLESVAEVDGVRYVNDSKATNPHAAAAALASFRSVVWIAGGLHKGVDLDVLAAPLRGRVRAVVTVGEAGPRIARLGRRLGLCVVEAGTVAAAVPAAARLAEPGDTVLLSPACASMDQFRDYAERGEAFRAAVAALTREGARGA